ncbi:hypothetical protein F4777DRAFT_540723 [Nemania sp. FL0916]|nr:hypothetical protein F4777DRAFT_540723 [Nemania sp. FL0916]
MAATQDWSPANFHAFAGAAQLDATYMAKTMTGGHEDLAADVLKFYRWIEHLRGNVGPTNGIPNDYVTSVQDLLTAFFPQMQPNDEWMPAARVRSVGDQGIVEVVTLADFGTATPKERLQIVDGATALGYIFSVATPPANPTWLSYYLPLAALYCRFLYLAYVLDRTGGANPGVFDASADLPQMSCVMYAGETHTVRYIYGATAAKIPGDDPDRAAERINAPVMLDRYRREQVLAPALNREVPGVQIPRYSPRRIADLATRLWTRLAVTAEFNSLVDPLRTMATNLQTSIINIYELLPTYPPGTLQALPLARVFGHAVWKQALLTDLKIIVRDRFLHPAAYDENNLNAPVVAAWENAIKNYIAPHIYLKTDTAFAVNIADPASQTAVDIAVNQIINPLWAQFRATFLQQLEDLFQEQMNRPDHTPFGRCAETYCVAGMLSHYFPHETMDHVRGISLGVPAVGSSDKFSAHFGTPQLGDAAAKSPYRLPCINCQQLLPLYNIDMANYNIDIWATPDRNGKDPY